LEKHLNYSIRQIRCRCPCACHPFEFQATPLGLVGLCRGPSGYMGRKINLFWWKLFIWHMFKEEHPYRTVTSWVKKIRIQCPCACIPFEFKATPLGLLGLGGGVLQAIWDEKSTSFDENFSFGALFSFKEEQFCMCPFDVLLNFFSPIFKLCFFVTSTKFWLIP